MDDLTPRMFSFSRIAPGIKNIRGRLKDRLGRTRLAVFVRRMSSTRRMKILRRIGDARWFGPALGGAAGLLGGIPGAVIGILMGYLVQELSRQLRTDRAIRGYYENPGHSVFYEVEPGLAAYCALGVLVVSKSINFREGTARSAGGNRQHAAYSYGDEGALTEQVVLNTLSGFSLGAESRSFIESFCRTALACRSLLNPYLLAESLAARRAALGDLPRLGRKLESLAFGEAVLEEVRGIRSILDKNFAPPGGEASGPGESGEEPWRILGLEPGASMEAVKSRFRKLAVQFHPDVLQGLDKKYQEAAVRTFIRIQEAYRELTGDTGRD
jgi:DnaJ-domain-containing protein 1